jgi:hypothetical protein
MPPGLEHIWGAVATAVLILFIMYRRFRRLFGRQPLRPARMIARMAILSIIGVLLVPAALRSSDATHGIGAGLALGVALGVWGARHTRYEWHEGALHYVPHTYAGVVVSALFLGRLLYRFLILWQSGSSFDAAAAGSAPGGAFGTLYHNPLTLGVFFVLIGYYVCYYGYVLWEFKHGKRAQSAPGAAVNPSLEDRNKPHAGAS